MSHATAMTHLRAMADADPTRDDDLCGHSGPGGECVRDRGHYDDGVTWTDTLTHYSYDTDHYVAWPVGWKSPEQRLTAIHDPHFASALTGNPDYRKGVEDTLRLVRATLANPRG